MRVESPGLGHNLADIGHSTRGTRRTRTKPRPGTQCAVVIRDMKLRLPLYPRTGRAVCCGCAQPARRETPVVNP
jgi:hypothetical protein